MLAASQEIDSFIERQRSQLNKQPSRQTTNRPHPPPVQPSIPPPPPNNVHDRLDFRVARILDEPPPRVGPPPQSYPSANSNHYANNPPPRSDHQVPFFPEPQEHRRLSADANSDNPVAFFNKFGTYDDKRTQLKDDLKREYNEYLQSQKQVGKSKSTSQLASPRTNNAKRVQFQPNGKVVAPWEKGEQKSAHNVQSMQDLSTNTNDFAPQRQSRPPPARYSDEQQIRDREEYILELHSQIRELEARKKQLEIQSSKLSAGGSSSVTRAHYTEDLNALNSLLAERLDQRNAVDMELAHILNRPPVSSSPTRIGSGNIPMMNMPMEPMSQPGPPQRYPPPPGRGQQPYRNDQRSGGNDNGFQIGNVSDKDSEQAAKKRYQQELQAQMREAQMRKADAKREKDEYDRKLEADIQRYNYFGRGGGGAPMRDKEGNVVANLADLRNPSQPNGPPEQYSMPDDKVYKLGNGTSAMSNAPFYMGEQTMPSQPTHQSNTDRSGSPNHARGAMSNGMFGAAKTEEQFAREEKYKQDLKRQIDEKRQREAEEAARRRAEDERELAKHLEWQQQMDRQTAEEAARKQEKEAQERVQQQQMQEELERQRRQDEIVARRRPKRVEKPPTPKQEEPDDQVNPPTNYDESDQHLQAPVENAYRSSSPPIPAIKNKGKKPKAKNTNFQRPSFDDASQRASPPALPPFVANDEFIQPKTPEERAVSQGRQTYRKPPTPGQPEVTSARKKPPQSQPVRSRTNSNAGMAIRANSNLSLRSDGSDSEVLNRLEHLKRQLRDKEARLQEHVTRHQDEVNNRSNIDEAPRTTYQPPNPRKQSPRFLTNAAKVHHRESPTSHDRVRRLLETDDDLEYRPGYFRDDTTLMNGAAGGLTGRDLHSAHRRDSSDQIFGSNIEREANRRRHAHDHLGYYNQDDPTTMANFELNRIAEQNEQRLKKLRDLENDDASLLDSNEVLERFQQRQRLQRGGSQTTLQDDAWLK